MTDIGNVYYWLFIILIWIVAGIIILIRKLRFIDIMVATTTIGVAALFNQIFEEQFHLYYYVDKSVTVILAAVYDVYNTNGYDLTDTLRLLDGVVNIYMPDIKFSDDNIAEKYLKVKNYYRTAKAAVKEMYKQVGNLKTDDRNIAYKGLLIRHLVLPQNLAGTEEIMRFIAEEISIDTYVNIMAQYYPAHKSFEFKELTRRISMQEYQYAINCAKSAGLKRYKSNM